MKKKDKHSPENPSAAVVPGNPETAFEMVNKYGTYNIQPTADSDHLYPAIAQGLTKELTEREKDT